MQWMMLQRDEPKDYVIATGEYHSVRDFVIWAADTLGIEIEFSGTGEKEIGVVSKVTGERAPGIEVGQTIIKSDARYYRPAEVNELLGDAQQAKIDLGWEPTIHAKELCVEMVDNDYKTAQQQLALKKLGLY